MPWVKGPREKGCKCQRAIKQRSDQHISCVHVIENKKQTAKQTRRKPKQKRSKKISEPTYCMSKKGTCFNNIFSIQTVPTRKATSCGFCEVVRNQKRKGIKKDRANIFRVCMFSYRTFITNTSVVSGYVG